MQAERVARLITLAHKMKSDILATWFENRIDLIDFRMDQIHKSEMVEGGHCAFCIPKLRDGKTGYKGFNVRVVLAPPDAL